MKKIIPVFLIMLFIGSCGKKEQQERKIVVSVGDSILTMEMIYDEIPVQFESKISRDQIKNYIQQWIEKELIYQAALKLGMDMESDYRVQLEKAKKDLLVRKYLDHQLIEPGAEVADDEIVKYYEDNQESFMIANSEIHALHILVATNTEANQARRRILNGEDFETVAKEVSIDYEKKNRIDLGFFSRNDILPKIATSLFSYRTGSVTRPIKSSFGYHIFKLLERRENGTYRELEEVDDQIISRLQSIKKKQQYRELINQLRNRMIVKKNENYLKQIYTDSTFTN